MNQCTYKKEEQTLIILKIDYYEEGSLTPIVEYEIFHPITKEALNLEYCNETKIKSVWRGVACELFTTNSRQNETYLNRRSDFSSRSYHRVAPAL